MAEKNYRKFKAGFIITLDSRDDGITDGTHEGIDGLSLVSQNPHESCQWKLSGTLIRRRNKFIQLMGNLENLDSAVRLVEGISSGYMRTTTQKIAESMSPCHELPLITYGTHP